MHVSLGSGANPLLGRTHAAVVRPFCANFAKDCICDLASLMVLSVRMRHRWLHEDLLLRTVVVHVRSVTHDDRSPGDSALRKYDDTAAAGVISSK